MDDVLIAGSDEGRLYHASQELVSALQSQGLQISPENVQIHLLIYFWVLSYFLIKFFPKKFIWGKIPYKHLIIIQRLLGDINWLRPYLKLTMGELKPLFDILSGDSDPSSPRMLTQEARDSLAKVWTKCWIFLPRSPFTISHFTYILFSRWPSLATQASVLGPSTGFSL